ncbi:MAG TPA: GspH/FimT family pseudopilin [Candidatus Bathyarchaeia archaeon]|nr:GspH/FimT family pseudopilin [Candidatus Bathyarchaeia archaeon]
MMKFFHRRLRCAVYPRAFTLVELLLVTMIIVAALALSIPRFSGTYRKLLLTSTQDKIASAMRFAQTRALMRMRPVRLVFSSDVRSYWLEEWNAQEDSYERLTGEWSNKYAIPDGISATIAEPLIEFDKSGEPQPVELAVCLGQDCGFISTKIQYGRVSVIPPQEAGGS